MDGEENIPLQGWDAERNVDDEEQTTTKSGKPLLTLKYCNEHSRLYRNEAENSTTFYFDYLSENKSVEILNWNKLRDLKLANKWGVLRHPFVLNYLNQKLIDCALFYTFHIIAFFLFLLLLSWHIFSPAFFKSCIVTVFVAAFAISQILKATLKARVSHRISAWFVVAFIFNMLTYAATLAYVWLPTVFKYDDYHQEVKHIILWFLPIVAIISAWINFLYILRKSPFGIYIFMMTRILKSFGHVAAIWIPTLIAFSFAFHLIMKDTGIKPWSGIDQATANATMITKLLVILRAVTKTSTMMIGEVDANDILDTNQWIPSILVLVFEIITVILLMNLMVSLAVGDVTDLKNTASDKLLKIKVNFVIEALQLSEQFERNLHTTKTENILVIQEDGHYFTTTDAFPSGEPRELSSAAYQLSLAEQPIQLHIRTLTGHSKTATIRKCIFDCVESPLSGIPKILRRKSAKSYENSDGILQKCAKWLIGLDWAGYLIL
ncbi:unnamed protein product [Caenorhabditis bovis]|uniref:Ion transport domain-containing protein n=1 Tax=Caenorhabditis bovis TaxID=2654633 RepID=A0A8S1F5S1_9PELO|nr:unnamed protein product [Caenorhabditis bovis]